MQKRIIVLLILLALLSASFVGAQDSHLVETQVNAPVQLALSIPDGLATPVTFSIDGAPANGALMGTAPNFIYTPNRDFAGVDTLTYTVIGSDGNFATMTVEIQVTGMRALIAAPELNNEFRTLAAEPVDFEMARGANYEITRAPQHGVLAGQVPSVSYVPDSDFVGEDSFEYRVTINGETQTYEVNFLVDRNPELAGDVPPAPSIPREMLRRAEGLPGLTTEVSAIAQPGINNSLDSYAGNLANVFDGATVAVIITSRDLAAAQNLIMANGGTIETSAGNQLVARVPSTSLATLGADGNIANVRLPQEPMLLNFTGTIETEGTAFMDVDDWHNAGFTGTGVKVGIIDSGFTGFYTTASVEVACANSPYDMTTSATYVDSSSADGVHGTAVTETVCDVAPDADVYPVHVFTDGDFVNAINYLITTHDVDIITASLGWPMTAADGETHITAQAVNDAVTTHNVIFTIATGNSHQGHYEGAFSPYPVTPAVGDPYTAHDFQETASTSTGDWGNTLNGSNAVDMPVGAVIDYSLVWEDDWSSVANDFDLYLWWWDTGASAWDVVAGSFADNLGGNYVGERIQYTIPSGRAGWYRILIREWASTGNPWLQLYEVNRGNSAQYRYAYSSVSDPSAAPNAFGVGAVYWSTGALEAYSSVGPSNTTGSGAPLPGGHFQPQVAAPTGGDTVSYPSGFFGTSGATPHVAGAAAIVMSAYPSWDNTQVETFLKNAAANNDAGDIGPDYSYGNGILKLGTPPADGTDTIGIYRDTDRSWYLRNSNSGGFSDLLFPYGDPSDVAVVGDWDGDGDDSVGIFRNGTFYLKNTNDAGNADISFGFGDATDIPVAGDWDGDGTDTVGIYRPSTGFWFLTNSPTGGSVDLNFQYGLLNETPVAGDWNGDGTDTVGIFRASDRSWYLRNSNSGGSADIVFDYGDPSLDIPVVGDWDGDGVDTVGIYRFGIGEWYLKNSNAPGNADIVFTYGLVDETPVVGDWDGQ